MLELLIVKIFTWLISTNQSVNFSLAKPSLCLSLSLILPLGLPPSVSSHLKLWSLHNFVSSEIPFSDVKNSSVEWPAPIHNQQRETEFIAKILGHFQDQGFCLFRGELQAVWPDLAIFGLWATFESLWQQFISLNLQTFLGNFLKLLKSIIFLV